MRINLLALGSTLAFECACHRKTHDSPVIDGKPCHATMLLLVATRENVLQPHIEEVIWMLRRLPKRPTEKDVLAELDAMQPGARALARLTLAEVPCEQQTWRWT